MNFNVCRNCKFDKCLMVMFDHFKDDGSKPATIDSSDNPLVRAFGYDDVVEVSMRLKGYAEYIFEKEGMEFVCKYHKSPNFMYDESMYEVYLPEGDDNKNACPYYAEHLLSFLNREAK